MRLAGLGQWQWQCGEGIGGGISGVWKTVTREVRVLDPRRYTLRSIDTVLAMSERLVSIHPLA
jgi:hypothetical protein